MRNSHIWLPSKYVLKDGSLVPSEDEKELNVASRLVAALVAQEYAASIPKHARGRLLDLGCGSAPLYAMYRPYVTDVTCVDWPASLHDSTYVDANCDLSQPLPFANDAFDTIILSDVLEHIPNPHNLWAEMARILDRGGKLLLNVPFMYPMHEMPHDYYRYTRFALERFANENGLHVISLHALGGSPEVLADLMAKHLAQLPVVGKLAARIVQSLALRFGRTHSGHRLSQRTSAHLPLGYFVVAEKPAP